MTSLLRTPAGNIDRNELHWQLVQVAMVRSLVTMLSFLPLLMGVLALSAALAPHLQQLLKGLPEFLAKGILVVAPLLVVFGPSLLLSELMTKLYCRKAILCPRCGASLWGCGSGNFKPRRMQIRPNVCGCLKCGLPIR